MSTSAGQVRHAGKARPRGRLVAAGLCAASVAATTAAGGVVFREAETIEAAAGGGSRQIRQVLAEGEACKVVLEDAGEPLIPIGAYVLATTLDAFLVDPAGRAIAPLDPTTMVPAASPAEPVARPTTSAVAVELLFEAPGPALLGLPTRHLVYRLDYLEGPPGAVAPAARHEERHELWVAPWAEGEVAPPAWYRLRVAEDGGPGPERAELREALAQMYGQGFVLRQVIERLDPAVTPGAGRVVRQRVLRDVTSFSREPVPPAAFERPPGYAYTEFLAPPAEEPDAAAGADAPPAADGP